MARHNCEELQQALNAVFTNDAATVSRGNTDPHSSAARVTASHHHPLRSERMGNRLSRKKLMITA